MSVLNGLDYFPENKWSCATQFIFGDSKRCNSETRIFRPTGIRLRAPVTTVSEGFDLLAVNLLIIWQNKAA